MRTLPPALRNLLLPQDAAAAAAVNRSLIFDKTPEPDAREWKCGFFTTFAEEFRQHEGEYDAFITRRTEAFSNLGIRPLDLESTSRLIIGHGLPHTTKAGFLFDRLRGVPYLPGSTVKGLLRGTAKLVVDGEIAADSAVRALAENADETFGMQAFRGALVCEDGYAVKWPRLEVDVMTPHHQQYYREKGAAPGDWESPIPVYFLTIAPNQVFRFWFSGDGAVVDPSAVGTLLRLGLEWLGVGGKKSSGYGRFWPLGGDASPRAARDVRTPPAPPPVAVWPDAQLTFTPNDGYVTARWQGRTARARNLTLPDWFRKKKIAQAKVTVEGFTITSIEWPPK